MDLEGRPWRLVDEFTTYRWGLNGRALAVRRNREGEREHHWVEREEAVAIWETVRNRLSPLLDRVGSDGLPGLEYIEGGAAPPDRRELNEALTHLAGRDTDSLRADFRRFTSIYTPVGILPPDQYMAKVIQITEGCPFNTCTFCSFYRDATFRIKSLSELREHLAMVDDFLGRGALLRRNLFLGDANALAVPVEQFIPLLSEVRDHYSGETAGMNGIHAFLDGFSGAVKSIDDYIRLRELGLERVCIGMESGHDPLLEWLNKPGDVSDVIESVRSMKVAGIQISLVILLGAGGERFAEGHVRDSSRILSELPLDSGDFVYFSEFVDRPGTPYGIIARRENVKALERSAVANQRAEIAAALRPVNLGGPRRAIYDIREFTY